MLNGLYLITDENLDGHLPRRVEAALQGGARIVQYRCKNRPAGPDPEVARDLAGLCRRHGALLLINDDVDTAVTCDAAGVHLGQNDLPVAEARRRLGRGKLIGISTRTVEQARKAQAQGADYVAVGSIYGTGTKDDAVHVGLDTLKKVRLAVQVPVVAIGGINASRIAEVIDAGADAVAVVSAVMADPRPAVAARELALQFHRSAPLPRGRVLTIAGSDSGGGAGIQADIKTIALLGSYGASAVTALTAQNTCGVYDVQPAPPAFVARQIEVVLKDIGADTVKTGMLFSADIVALVAEAIERRGLLAVVDPVMIAKGGSPLLQQTAVEILREVLLPQTYLLTPNLPEAAALTGLPVDTEVQRETALRRLGEMGPRHVLLKGGHLEEGATDLLLAGGEIHRFAGERLPGRNTHGTGCSFSAAIATFLAQGDPLNRAVARAKIFITEAIRSATDLGSGHGPVNHWQGAKKAGTEDPPPPVGYGVTS